MLRYHDEPCNASCSVGSVGAASCPPSFGSTSTLAIEGDPVAIAAQTSTQRKCVVKDSLGRTGARFGVLLLHTMTQKSQTPIMVTRYRRIDMHCGKRSDVPPKIYSSQKESPPKRKQC